MSKHLMYDLLFLFWLFVAFVPWGYLAWFWAMPITIFAVGAIVEVAYKANNFLNKGE